jgi:hypothetical protein
MFMNLIYLHTHTAAKEARTGKAGRPGKKSASSGLGGSKRPVPSPISPIPRASGVYDSGDEQEPLSQPLEGRAEAKKRRKGEQKSPKGIFLLCYF